VSPMALRLSFRTKMVAPAAAVILAALAATASYCGIPGKVRPGWPLSIQKYR
jgi:hypothetical protein